MDEARRGRWAPAWVFGILFVSNAFFWHSRDWNSASRLMLVYSVGDRGTISIDGLETQTGDLAYYKGRYYTEKQPGYSLLGLPAYLGLKAVFGWPDHPLNREGLARWPADYGVTLLTSGLMTALGGAVLTWYAGRLGCGARRALLVGLAYGLSTPAYVYATMAYGHQVAGCCLLGSFVLVERAERGSRRLALRMVGAGFLAAYGSVVELAVGPVSAVLGLFLVGKVAARRLPVGSVGWFSLGALGPTLILLGYNWAAFGSPVEMGYGHLINPRFKEVHSEGNPLGLRGPDWSKVGPLLIGTYRGLLWYAPVVVLAPVGWVRMLIPRRWAASVVSMVICGSVFLVNLSYPEWTGGWTTGPRFLVPLLPFAMVGVAGAMSGGRSVWVGFVTSLTAFLAVVGWVLMWLYQGVGGRIPDLLFGEPLRRPLSQVIWPLWSGARVPGWWIGGRFTETVVSVVAPGWVEGLPSGLEWVQFLPMVGVQAGLIGLAVWWVRPRGEMGFRRRRG